MTRFAALVTTLTALLLLQACTGKAVAPVDNRKVKKEPVPATSQRGVSATRTTSSKNNAGSDAGYHVVVKGDTLYSISWRYQKDYKQVAGWNRISSPYTIFPGQLIRLKPPVQQANGQPVRKKRGIPLKPEQPATLPATPPTKTVAKPTAKKPAKASAKPALPSGPISWSWPTRGNIVKSNSPTSKKGIDISGKSGQTIKAAAAGEVVYSGSGLFGYGKLIIIKHNETYLSAYAYNSKLLVKEGDRVNSGQTISYMGQDNTGRTVLHFEIRKNGKPINPIKYLPRKSA